MSESKNEGGQDAPAKSANPKGKTPNMAQLNKQFNVQTEATNERFDAIEVEVTEMSEKMDKVLSVLEGMSAKARPTGTRPMTESEEQEQGDGGVVEVANDGSLELVAENRDIEDPAMQQKLERMKFNEDILEIFLHDTAEEQSDHVVEISCNGRRIVMFRNPDITYRVPRCLVEVLARAKPNSFENQEYVDNDGVMKVRYPRKMGVRYPFSVVSDPAGRMGQEWLKSVLSDRH